MSVDIEGHISRAFDGELSALHVRVVELGGFVLLQVREAASAYTDWEERAAQSVLERERQVNSAEARLEADSLQLIARRQPVASDLRAILALTRAVAELGRAADEAKKIALTVLGGAGRAGQRPGPATARDARHLARLAVSLVRLAIDALDRLDGTKAREVVARDHELDSEYADGMRRLLTRAMKDPRQFGVALEAAFVLKSLERIGDHARNLARFVLSISGDRSDVSPQPAATR